MVNVNIAVVTSGDVPWWAVPYLVWLVIQLPKEYYFLVLYSLGFSMFSPWGAKHLNR
jgi:hypothetical protein